jgi:hypothetical protein
MCGHGRRRKGTLWAVERHAALSQEDRMTANRRD